MTLVISRLVLTVILGYLVFLVWTKQVDVFAWVHQKAMSILPIAEQKSPSLIFSASAEFGLDPIEIKEYKNEEPSVWRKARLMYRISALTKTTAWSENTLLGVIFYSADRLYTSESKLPEWIIDQVAFKNKPPHHRILHHTVELGRVNSARAVSTGWMHASISIDHAPWQAAIYLLEPNQPAQWFQLDLSPGNPTLHPRPGQGVQVRDFELPRVVKPVVSSGDQRLLGAM